MFTFEFHRPAVTEETLIVNRKLSAKFCRHCSPPPKATFFSIINPPTDVLREKYIEKLSRLIAGEK